MTPATTQVKKITEMIEEMLLLISESENNDFSIKTALASLTQVVKNINKNVLDLASTQSLGMDMSLKLSNRTNAYFIKFLKQWLISDSVASYFVFDLEGFEFLLDTIGIGADHKGGETLEVIEREEEKQQLQPEEPQKKTILSLLGSDLQ